jgi:hypothetical protein
MAATAPNTELPGTVLLITMTSLGPDWHGKTVPMLWRSWFAASTHPILLRMGTQTLKVPHGTVLVLTIRFARSSSCHGPWFDVFAWWTLFALNTPQHWHKHSESRCDHTHLHTMNTCVTRNNTREPHTADLNTTPIARLIIPRLPAELCLVSYPAMPV